MKEIIRSQAEFDLASVLSSLARFHRAYSRSLKRFAGIGTLEALGKVMAQQAVTNSRYTFAVHGPKQPLYYAFGGTWMEVGRDDEAGFYSITIPAKIPSILRPTGQVAVVAVSSDPQRREACLRALNVFEPTFLNSLGLDDLKPSWADPDVLLNRLLSKILASDRKQNDKRGLAIDQREVLFGDLDLGTVGWIRVRGVFYLVARSRSRMMRHSAPGEALYSAGFSFSSNS